MKNILKVFKVLSSWGKIADWILKYRLPIIIFLLFSTLYMGYLGQKAEIIYEYQSIVPDDDPDLVFLRKFRKTYGEEASIFALSVKDPKIFQLENFKKLEILCQNLKKLEGVNDVLALPNIRKIQKDDSLKKFKNIPLFEPFPTTQKQLDSLLKVANSLKFYDGQLINAKNGTLLVAISIDKSFLNSKKRLNLTPQITDFAQKFEKETNITVHYGGLPYIRSVVTGKVKQELELFLLISLIVTALVVVIFYKSWQPLVVSIVLIIASVLWAMASLVLLNYKISILMGLMPPILVIIAIPNSVYLITKFHQEFRELGDKVLALKNVVKKIGFVTVVVNLTTAFGFIVFAFSKVEIFVEFGIAISVNILITFFLSILIIPIFFSYLPEPSKKSMKHLDFQPMQKMLDGLVYLALNHRKAIYLTTFVVILISIWGGIYLKPLAFIVDDLPKNNTIRRDLKFFEDNFKGILPIELVVDTKKPKGVRKRGILQKIDSLQTYLYQQPEIGKPLSLVEYLKGANQAYFNDDSAFYELPSNRDWVFFQKYVQNDQDNDAKKLAKAFVDSTEQNIRLSFKIADIGTIKMHELIEKRIQPKIDQLFPNPKEATVQITGTTPVFMKGNDYLINSLLSSTLMAVLLVALAHGLLFTSLRLIIISIVPNIIPMFVTVGLMGFFGIPLKPSTSIIFSIVLGIAVDNTVHFLAHYRMKLEEDADHLHAVITSLKETGFSMVYTSIVLFAGFITFVASEFGGTVALGKLTSVTLFVALITNLTILPALLITFDKPKFTDDETGA
jgi:uncharacterized protein